MLNRRILVNDGGGGVDVEGCYKVTIASFSDGTLGYNDGSGYQAEKGGAIDPLDFYYDSTNQGNIVEFLYNPTNGRVTFHINGFLADNHLIYLARPDLRISYGQATGGTEEGGTATWTIPDNIFEGYSVGQTCPYIYISYNKPDF